MEIPDVAYYGYSSACGLAEAARSNALAMQWAGYTVMRAESGETGPPNPEVSCPLVVHHWHPWPGKDFTEFFTSGKRPEFRVAYWAWECERSFHPGMKAHAKFFDEIWTPSDYTSNLLRGLGVPVRTIRHATRRSFLPVRPRGVIFKVVAPFDAWSRFSRKNPAASIAAFKLAFPRDQYPNCELVLKTHHLKDSERDQLIEIASDSRITVQEGFLSEQGIQNFFLDADCELSLHRSEGFGLNLARAINYGLPLVATNYGGCAEWMDHVHKVNWTPVQLDREDYYAKGSWWAEPDIEHAAEHLRWVHDNPEEATEMAQYAKEQCDFSLETLSERFWRILSEIGVFRGGEDRVTSTR